MGEPKNYICPDCGTGLNLKENDKLICPQCYRIFRKSTYDFIHDLGMHDARTLFKEEHNEEPPNPNAVVLTRDEVMCSPMGKFICQFKNGVDTQWFSAKEVADWLCSSKYKYGQTWRCWSKMPAKLQEKETPWEEDDFTKKPPLGCAPSYVYISARICELCEAIKRYSTESGKHNQIALWCKEILYLNEMDRNLRYDEKCKVWKEDKDGTLKEMP